MKRILTHLMIVLAASLGLAALGASDAAAGGNKHYVHAGNHGHGNHGHRGNHRRGHNNHRWKNPGHFGHGGHAKHFGHNDHGYAHSHGNFSHSHAWKWNQYHEHAGHGSHGPRHGIDLGWLFGSRHR